MVKKCIEGNNMWLEPSLPGISKELAKKGGREFAFMWILRKESLECDIAYDIGANIGYTTLSLASNCKKVIAFEPDKRSWLLLKKNCGKLENVELHRIALTDYCGKMKLYMSNKPNQTSAIARVGKSKKIDCSTLDKFFDKSSKTVFIKADVEGAEVSILRGSKSIFESDCKIKLLLELHPNCYNNNNDFRNTLKALDRYNMKPKYIINAKGFKHMFGEPIKEFEDYPRAVFNPMPNMEELIYKKIEGKKIIRSVMWER